MTHGDSHRFLHVANGSCTTRLMEASRMPGRAVVWADPLYDGPVPGGLTDAELVAVRARHHAGPTEAAYLDVLNNLRSLRAAIQDHEAYDELILWLEHDLFDQLILIQILSWIRTCLPASKAVSLICVNSFPGRARFMGLGELAPEELASLLDTRQPVSEEQYSLAERGWNAFREPTPDALDHFRGMETAALPYLAAAMTRLLQEYPWTTDGLSRTERRLLRLAEAGPVALTTAFPRMHDGEDAYYVSDTSVADLVDAFTRVSPPLLARVSEGASRGGVLQGSVTLTVTGREILAGRQDRVALYGIDRWVGGVHLRSASDIWRWDDERGRIGRF